MSVVNRQTRVVTPVLERSMTVFTRVSNIRRLNPPVSVFLCSYLGEDSLWVMVRCLEGQVTANLKLELALPARLT